MTIVGKVSVADPGFSETGNTWIGHRRGTGAYARLQIAMMLAGIATFAQLYAPQALLPQISQAFNVSAADSALMVSMGTGGLAFAVVPWSLVADRIGRKRTMSIAVVAATVLGILATLMPTFELTLTVRLFEGFALGGVPAVALAYINEEVHKIDAATAVGTFVAGNTIGGLSGRLIAGPVGEFATWEIGFLAVIGLSVIAAVLFIALSPRPQGFIPMGRAGGTVVQSIQDTLANAWRHLKSPVMLALYSQPFLLMGGFVAVYNFLGYYLAGPPFLLPVWLSSFAFLAYLAGTFASPFVGGFASRFGRKRIKLICDTIAITSMACMLIPNITVIVTALAVFTAAFFGSHTVASGWAAALPTRGRAQSTALYNLCYYLGSSVLGFIGGLFFQFWGWDALLAMVGGLYVIAMLLAIVFLPGRPKQPVAT